MKDSKIINFLVGLFTLIVVVFFYGMSTPSGGVRTVYGLLGFAAFSIFCTAGITAVVWLPGLWLLGTVVTKTLGLFFGKKTQPLSTGTNTQSVGSTPSSNSELAIIGYIVSSRNLGTINDTIIRANLKSGGWNDVDIDSAFKKSVPRT
ncbi:MAG: hypothetical protein WC666_03745 [Candidatus Paceibacterota bacterium]|jgi:hypothetical protein